MSSSNLQLHFFTNDEKLVKCSFEDLQRSAVVQSLMKCNECQHGTPPIYMPTVDAKSFHYLIEWIKIGDGHFILIHKPEQRWAISVADKHFLQNLNENELISLIDATDFFGLRYFSIIALKHLRDVESLRISKYYRRYGQQIETDWCCPELRRYTYILPQHSDSLVRSSNFYNENCESFSDAYPYSFAILELRSPKVRCAKSVKSVNSVNSNSTQDTENYLIPNETEKRNSLLAAVRVVLTKYYYSECIRKIVLMNYGLHELTQTIPNFSNINLSIDDNIDLYNCEPVSKIPKRSLHASLQDLHKESSVTYNRHCILCEMDTQMYLYRSQINEREALLSDSGEWDDEPNSHAGIHFQSRYTAFRRRLSAKKRRNRWREVQSD